MPSLKNAPVLEVNTWPDLPADTPIIYEDEELGDMGEANRHYTTNETVHVCLKSFLVERQPHMRVFANMNCYYAAGPKHKRTGSLPYISADNMIVEPFETLSEDTVSYTIGRSGPSPLATIEALSLSTMTDTDFGTKIKIYSALKIPEYIIVDVTGELLPEKLLLKRLQLDGTWEDERDADGGITSSLGFRLLIDDEGELAVLDAKTGKRYVRPQDAQAAVEAAVKARKQAERKARDAEKKLRDAEKKAGDAAAKAQAEAEALSMVQKRLRALQAELDRLHSQRDDA